MNQTSVPTQNKVAIAFEKAFLQNDIKISPHKNSILHWVFYNANKLLLGVIILSIITTIGIVIDVPKVENVLARSQLELEYPHRTHTWCYLINNTDTRFYTVYAENNIDCATVSKEKEPVAQFTTDFSEEEIYAVFILRQMVYIFLPILFSIMLSVAMFYRLLQELPKTLLYLARSEKIIPNISKEGRKEQGIRPRGWESYPEDLLKAIQSSNGDRYFGAFILLAAVMGYLFSQQMSMPDQHSFWTISWFVIVLGFTALLLAYIAGYGIWLLTIIARYLRWLTPIFALNIQPEHQDGSGGLKKLGNLCFRMGVIIVPPASVFAAYGLLGMLGESIAAFKGVVGIAALIAITVTTIAFFFPLWDIHQEMSDAKEKYQDEAAQQIAKIKRKLHTLLSQDEQDDAAIKKLEGKLEKLQKLYPADFNYPTWPFTTSVVLTFYTSQIVPITTVVAGMLEFFNLFGTS